MDTHSVVFVLPMLTAVCCGYTLSQPGQSQLTYTFRWHYQQSTDPESEKTTPLEIHLRLRTWKSHAVIGQISFYDPDSDEMNQYGGVIVELAKGELVIRAASNGYSEEYSGYDSQISQDTDYLYMDDTHQNRATGGKGVNNNKWHDLNLTLDATIPDLQLTLDGCPMTSVTLQEGWWPHTGVNTNSVKVNVTFGGSGDQSFIGCIEGVEFFTNQEPINPNMMHSEVEPGCVDNCESDPCASGGSCTNTYSGYHCDCLGTSYEGSHCKRKGLTTVTLQGSEWLTFRVFKTPDELLYAPYTRIALQFKTSAPDGVLFYGRHTYPSYSHVALSISTTTLHVSVVFENEAVYSEIYTSMGAGLDDNRWHSVVLTLSGRDVTIILDTEREHMSADVKVTGLTLPEVVYYGGLEVTAENEGLKSTEGFRGCLREMYFNHISLLGYLQLNQNPNDDVNPRNPAEAVTSEDMRDVTPHDLVTYDSTVNRGVTVGCLALSDSCLQFTHDGAFAVIEKTSAHQFSLSLELKTLKSHCVLLYNRITGQEQGTGFLQLSLVSGKVELTVTRGRRNLFTVSLGNNLHDNTWHMIGININSRLLTVQVDEREHFDQLTEEVTFDPRLYLAYGPVATRDSGFIGCFRHLVISAAPTDPSTVFQHPDTTAGVTLGSCDLTNLCEGQTDMCEHGGECVSVWDKVTCRCERSQYTGRYCQFGQLPRSCDEHFHRGVTASGVYLIDPDGGDDLFQPVAVHCDMGVIDLYGNLVGRTVVDHNLHADSELRGPGVPGISKIIAYRVESTSALTQLVRSSAHCEQTVTFNCVRSPLNLGVDTWLSALGTDNIRPWLEYSHCDLGLNQPMSDTVTIIDPAHLPVTQISAKVTSGHTNVTLSHLLCYGDVSRTPETTVTLRGHGFGLRSAWQGGDLRFEFRTRLSNAVILYQRRRDGQYGAEVKVELRSGNQLSLTLLPLSLTTITVVTATLLSDTRWHSVAIDARGGEIRIRVDWETFIVRADRGHRLVSGDTELFVGGDPSISPHHGFEGCIRGLVIDGKVLPLAEQGRFVSGVYQGCIPQCDLSLCQNGAACVEDWTDYSCVCENPVTQSGHNCETDLNDDVIELHPGHAVLDLDVSKVMSVYSTSLIFSFRTNQPQAELLRVIDKNDNTLIVSLHNLTAIQVSIDGDQKGTVTVCILGLSDGSWKQVQIATSDDIMSLCVDDECEQSAIHKLNSKSSSPGNDYLLPAVYIGGFTKSKNEQSASGPYFTGCMRGLKIGNQVMSLWRKAMFITGISKGFSGPYADNKYNIQKNEGALYDCTGVDCQQDDQVCYFDGQTYIVQYLPQPLYSGGLFLQITFNFATENVSTPSMMLMQVLSGHGSSDNVHIYVSSSCTLIAQLTLDTHTVQLESSLNICDTSPHHVTLTRKQSQVIVKIDDETIERYLEITQCTTYAPPSLLSVGGASFPEHLPTTSVTMDTTGGYNYSEMDGYGNFVGFLSDLTVLSDQLTNFEPIRPFQAKTFNGTAEYNITVHGTLMPVKMTLQQKDMGFEMTDSEHSGGAAEEPVALANINPPLAQTATLTTPPAEEEGGGVSIPVVIGVCIGVLAVLALIVAVIYFRYCRKRQKEWSPGETVRQDEEEGLLTPASPGNSPQKKGVLVVETPETEKEAPKEKQRKSQLPQDDSEATPMLLSMQLHQPDDTVELTNFSKKLDQVPMIDAGDSESSLEDTPPVTSHSLPSNHDAQQQETPPSNGNNGEDAGSEVPDDQQSGDKQSPPPSKSPSGSESADDVPDMKVPLRGFKNPQREIFTESTVLAMLDDEDMHDTAGNTSFSSLPEDSVPVIDMAVRADVHHRLASYEGDRDNGLPSNNTNKQQCSNDNSKPDNTMQNDNDKNATEMQDSKTKSGKNDNSVYNTNHDNNNTVANGVHSNGNNHMTTNNGGPSVVYDHSLNEITAAPR